MPTLPKILTGAGVIVAGLVALTVIDPFYQVDSGYAGVLTDFGSVQPTALDSGLHFAIPFYQSVERVSIQPQTVGSDESASTHDLQPVTTNVAVTFHLPESEAPSFYGQFRDYDTFAARIITPNVSNDVKAVTAQYDAEDLTTKRDIIDAQIKSLITASLAPYDIIVDAVNIANYGYSDNFTQAIEAKQVAQQQALQAQYTLQQTQISAQQQVVQAKAQADAAVETATGAAQATILQAQAEAKANDLVNASLTPSILQLKAVSKWDGTMPTYLSSGTPLPFIGGATK